MAYNFENGAFFHQISQFIREACQSYQKTPVRFRITNASSACELYACKDMKDFYLCLCRLSGQINDRYIQQLFDEFCITFHNDNDQVDSSTYEWFSYVIGSSSLAVHPSIKKEFLRLLSIIHVIKKALKRVQELIAEHRKTTLIITMRTRNAINLPRHGNFAKDMNTLEVIAKNLAIAWNNAQDDIPHTPTLQILSYFRMNIRCRIVNYLRDVFSEMNSKTRFLILKRFEQATTIFHMLPFLGCDFLMFPDYSYEYCIFKRTNNCCVVRNDNETEAQVPLTFNGTISRLAVEFAISDISVYVYKACIAHNEIVTKKTRLSYTNNFA